MLTCMNIAQQAQQQQFPHAALPSFQPLGFDSFGQQVPTPFLCLYTLMTSNIRVCLFLRRCSTLRMDYVRMFDPTQQSVRVHA